MAELIVERLTGQPAPSYENDAMRWGKEQEPAARLAYGFMQDVEVEAAGFVSHPFIAEAGASPDGYVGDHGLVGDQVAQQLQRISTRCSTRQSPTKHRRAVSDGFVPGGAGRTSYRLILACMPSSMQIWVERIERFAGSHRPA